MPAAEPIGYRRLEDFAPRHLLELEACTRCGKCHEACPATAVGAPLSPRDLILDLARLDLVELAVGGGTITADTLWACMQCGACVEVCPVGIEHVPMINQLRRGLVEDGERRGHACSRCSRPSTARATPSASRGASARRWTRELAVPLKDARTEPVDWLWYVGDFASFDPRNQRATLALAKVLQRAGVDVGHPLRRRAHRRQRHPARRRGGSLPAADRAERETIAKCELPADPDERPAHLQHAAQRVPAARSALGRRAGVHHSQLLRDLLVSGRLQPQRSLAGACTFHDPCALGRLNGEYDAPREVIAGSGWSSSRCRGTATTRSAAARAAGASG